MRSDEWMKVSSVAAPVRQQVLASFRSAILSGRFPPGDRLIEKDLCALTGASRTSVREALRQLETEGLVEMIPNKGPIVASISPAQARSVYEVREALEGLVGFLFAQNATNEQMRRLEEAVTGVAEAYRHDSIEEILRKKDAFYAILIEGAGNEIVSSLLRMMHARISLLRRVSLGKSQRLGVSIKEIRAILKAVKARDAEAAAEGCRLHVRRAAEAAFVSMSESNGTTSGQYRG